MRDFSQLAFLKILPSFPPIGKHKHFRAIALQHNVQEATQRDVAMSVIWQTLQDLYDVEELGNLVSGEKAISRKNLQLIPQHLFVCVTARSRSRIPSRIASRAVTASTYSSARERLGMFRQRERE